MIALMPYTPEDREAYVALYEAAFPQGERKPFAYMTHPSRKGIYELWVITTPQVRVAGIVITVIYGDYVLLDYLAISPALRGQGIGHAVLPLIRDKYKSKHLFLEIEAPVPEAGNLTERLRRKSFYLSAGLTECHVQAYIYGTIMELLAYPDSAEHITFEVYAHLLKACFPSDMVPQSIL